MLNHFLLMVSLLLATSVANAYQGTQYRIGGAYERIRYSEGVMDEQGWLPGAYAGARWIFDYPYVISARVDYFNGNLKYNGSTWDNGSGSTPVLNLTTKDWIRTTEVLGEVRAGAFTFLIGLGQRVWSNDLVISYTRETTYWYLPVGFTFLDVNSGLYFKAVENYFLIGSNTSRLSEISHNPPYSDVTMKQRSGSGFTLELGWQGRNNPQYNVEAAVYYREWHVNASDTEVTGNQIVFEPKNKTDILGFNLGLVF